MGLRVIEIPSHPERGMDLDALQLALRQRDACARASSIPSFDNPNGSLMPYEARVRLLALLERHDVPLIEDDIYGDLAWDGSRPSPVKALDRSGRVLLCGSISKTIAAGYRVGWIVAGRYQARVERLKFSQSVATSTLEQMAVAEYLGSGGYDRHLRTLRGKLARSGEGVSRGHRGVVSRPAPRVSDPRGGFLLWVEMPRGVDALQLQTEAAARGIAIAPGPIFAAGKRYKSCIRINCGFPWSRRSPTRCARWASWHRRLARRGSPEVPESFALPRSIEELVEAVCAFCYGGRRQSHARSDSHQSERPSEPRVRTRRNRQTVFGKSEDLGSVDIF